jgi:GT2 family glycosyltransferase
VLAATTTQEETGFRGYGCRLLVPLMGTAWNREPLLNLTPVHVAACHATVITRELFERLEGYDPGMIFYGAGEPEFSIRAWLHGAEVVALPEVEVQHRFKPKDEMFDFLSSARPYWVQNCLRFGLLYLSEAGCLQLLRHYARTSPFFQSALRRIERSDVWERRRHLETRRERSFAWFAHRFGLRTQAGDPIP